MPYTKVLPISHPRSLSGKVAYISSAAHRNHVDKIVEPASFFKIQNSAEFLAKTVTTIRSLNDRRRRGRKIKNLADEVIIRMPDNSNLTPDERATYLNEIVAEFCPDSPAVAVWHLDRFNGSCDVHLIAANFEDSYRPQARRKSAFDPIVLARVTSDRITDLLNARRRELGIKTIETIPENRRLRMKERGILELAEQLVPLLPFGVEELPEKIASLGHEVTRLNLRDNWIGVYLSGGKKAHRYSIDRLIETTRLYGRAPLVPDVPSATPLPSFLPPSKMRPRIRPTPRKNPPFSFP